MTKTMTLPPISETAAPGADDTAIFGPDQASRTRRERWIGMALRAVSITGFFAVWYGAILVNAQLRLFNPILLPPPHKVLQAAIELTVSGELPRDIAASLYRVVCGFLVAALLGVGLGTLIGRSRRFEQLLEPVLELLRPIPPLAFLPVLVMWFGIGEMSKIVFIAYSAFFPIFTNTCEGIKFVDILLIRAAQTLGASEREIFRHVVVPAAMPGIITGLRVGFAQCLFVIVAAEFLASDSGLGYLINDARSFFLMSNMLVGAAVIGLIGFIFNAALRKLERRILRWRVDARGH
jgi:ABC-type nitrate/sulfonate/bicarbonate transport system permease component